MKHDQLLKIICDWFDATDDIDWNGHGGPLSDLCNWAGAKQDNAIAAHEMSMEIGLTVRDIVNGKEVPHGL